jgi:hypothetical protein
MASRRRTEEDPPLVAFFLFLRLRFKLGATMEKSESSLQTDSTNWTRTSPRFLPCLANSLPKFPSAPGEEFAPALDTCIFNSIR